MLTFCCIVRTGHFAATSCHVCAGASHLLPYPFTFPPLLYFLVSFTFSFSLFYLLHLFSCLSIPFISTRIGPFRFQAGCHRRWLNRALICIYLNWVILNIHSRAWGLCDDDDDDDDETWIYIAHRHKISNALNTLGCRLADAKIQDFMRSTCLSIV